VLYDNGNDYGKGLAEVFTARFEQLGGTAVEGSYFSDHVSLDDPRPEVQNFAAAYKKLYGDLPDATAILTYDATNLFLQALKKAGTAKGATLRDMIRDLTFKGVSGTTTFDTDRNPIKSAIIIQVKSGAFKYVTTIQP
jgi:branched-chain amino acid transport system substrate-binding protein